MNKFYYFQTLFFIVYSLWAGYNYVLAHRDAKCARAETVAIIKHLSLKELTEIEI